MDKASGPVQRQGAGEARAAPVGTKFYLDDIVRTTTGAAELALATGGRIEMPPNTALRFVARVGLTGMVIENGTITLSGTGKYRLELGTLTLVNGTVRIGGGKTPSVELVFGRGELDRDDGQHTPLEANKVLVLGIGTLVANVDAGVADAPIHAPSSEDITIEVSGDGATMQAPGDTKWGKLGSGSVAPGTRIALDAKTTAKLTIRGTTLDLAPGTRALVTSSRDIQIEVGAATAHAGSDGGQIAVPGGQVKLPANGAAIIDVGARGDAKVTAVTEGVQLIGKRGSVDVRQGELALVQKAGGVAPGELVIPAHYDYELRVGEPANITLHDPAGATAVRFAFATACKGGTIELARSSQFRSPLISVGDSAAHLMVRSGRWAYRVRCNGDQVASGHIIVLRDRGTRPLPKDPSRFEIAADGRNYRLDYQTRIPDVQLRAGGKGTTFKLHLASGKDERVFSSATGSFKVPGTTLREREYTFWVERDGVKSRVSTLRIGFDQTTAQVYIETPVDGRPWGPHIEVAGATLPGWTATIDGKSIPADKDTRRFGTLIPAPKDARAVAIQLSHPERGVHVYLRRGARR